MNVPIGIAMIAHDVQENNQSTTAVAEYSATNSPVPEDSLMALVERFHHGEIYAFDILLEQVTPRLLPLISRFVMNREDAQDALQEVAIQLYRALPRFRGECKVTTFLYRITVNVCLNMKKRFARRPLTFTDCSSPDTERSIEAILPHDNRSLPERHSESRERQQVLQEAIFSLRPQFRAVFILADVYGMSYEEIAEVTTAPLGAVRSRLHRARATMQQIILAHRELFEGFR